MEDYLDAYGLSYLRDPGAPVISREVIAGINNSGGQIVGSAANWTHEQVKFDESLEWYKTPVRGLDSLHQAYVCRLPGCRIKPSDLQRGKLLDSHPLMCSDGQQWQIPIARRQTDQGWIMNLPLVYGLDPATLRLTVDKVQEKYASLWAHVEGYSRALEQALAAGSDTFSYEVSSVEEFYLDVFQANYRVGLIELVWLEVLGLGMLDEIMSLLFDRPSDKLLEKKMVRDTGTG